MTVKQIGFQFTVNCIVDYFIRAELTVPIPKKHAAKYDQLIIYLKFKYKITK